MKKFWFLFMGFIACLYKDSLWRWPWLVAQAKHESGEYTNGWFLEGRNAWGMHVGRKSSRRCGQTQRADGLCADYRTFWSAWLDRLEWDDNSGWNPDGTDAAEYWIAVKESGRWGMSNSTGQYFNMMQRKFDTLPMWMQRFGTVAPWAAGKIVGVLALLLLLGVTITAVVLGRRYFRKRKR